jgi:hypothetical protein
MGLMRVGPDGGEATVLATEAAGVPLSFTNGVDVDQSPAMSTLHQAAPHIRGRNMRWSPRPATPLDELSSNPSVPKCL